MSLSKKTNAPKNLLKKSVGIVLAAAVLGTTLGGFMPLSQAETTVSAATADDYSLADTSQHGVILHAWNWSFNNIKENMEKIAECGYTSIQTSPIQIAKEDTKGKSVSSWWVYYQPAGFSIDDTGGSALGTKEEFKAMCEEAHKYGIHVIVDVVANHLGNKSNWTNLCTRAYTYEPDIADRWLFHDEGTCNDSSAYYVTKGQIGMPDLKTESSTVQKRVLAYLKECIDCGADGFRFDAAKHIETPDDGSQASNFWPTVIDGAKSYYADNGYFSSLYCYGEILNTCGGGRSYSSYTPYMSVTDNTTGNNITKAVNNGNASGAATPSYNTGLSASKIVLWAESHDTYSNKEKESTGYSTSTINKSWALVASRTKATALYFARSKGYCSGTLGEIESTAWCSDEVAAVNKFHNAFVGQSEYLSSSGSIAYNERGTTGVVLVNCSGTSASVSVTAHKIADGTYTDRISGNTFTVADGKIKGKIGSTGIAVVYNPYTTAPKATASPENTAFTDTLSISLKVLNATEGSYVTSEGVSGTFTNSKTITIGSKTEKGHSINVFVTAKNSEGKTVTEKYSYFKKDPDNTYIYFDNSSYNWTAVYAYIYDNSGSETLKNATWPGVQMTKNSDGLYEMKVPDELKNGKVIFTQSKSTSTNRYPADGESGIPINGENMIFTANHSWGLYIPDEPLQNYSTLSASSIVKSQSVTITGAAMGSTGTYQYAVAVKHSTASNYTVIKNYSAETTKTWTPSKSGKYTIIVKVKDSEGTVVSKSFTLNVSEKLTNQSALSATAITKGQSITINGAATGGKAPYQYAIVAKHSTASNYTVLKNYDGTNTKVWTPSKTGTYTVIVKVKDANGTIVGKSFTVTVQANGLTNNSVVTTTKIQLGKGITLRGVAEGGTEPYQYAMLAKHSTASNYTVLKSYDETNTKYWKPSKTGTYTVLIKVKDANGTVVSKSFTITVE
ncbi:MAG: alpha-amylase family glycosyl hydrolase [Acutalibacteraceae bacterium]